MYYTQHTKRDMTDIIPFLCPPKYQFSYYHHLFASTVIMIKYDFMLNIVLEFVCGDLDFSVEFFQSSVWSKMKKVLDDRYEPFFNLVNPVKNVPQKLNNSAEIYLAKMHQYTKQQLVHMNNAEHIAPNTLTKDECKDIISQFSPKEYIPSYNKINWDNPTIQKYNKMKKMGVELNAIINRMKLDGISGDDINLEVTNTKIDFWKEFKSNYFESIWMFITDGTMMNGFDYGEYESYYWFCGVLNSQIFRAKKSGKKIYLKVFVSCYTDDYNTNGDWGLRFSFSDSLEIFWLDIMSNWEYFKSYTIKQFNPNTVKM